MTPSYKVCPRSTKDTNIDRKNIRTNDFTYFEIPTLLSSLKIYFNRNMPHNNTPKRKTIAL